MVYARYFELNDFFHYFSLHVTAKPKLVKLPSVKIADIGDTPEVKCEGIGWPLPRKSWWRNGSRIHDGDYHSSYLLINLSGNTLAMKILAIDGYHHGTYTCRAENMFGIAEENVYVMVKSE